MIRREQGYAAIEKKMKENHINLCSVQSKEVLGDVEMLINLGYVSLCERGTEVKFQQETETLLDEPLYV